MQYLLSMDQMELEKVFATLDQNRMETKVFPMASSWDLDIVTEQ